MSDFSKKWKNKGTAARVLFLLAALWLSVAFLGYGIALRNYAETERRDSSGQFGGPYQVLTNKLEWIDFGWLRWTDPRFKIEGNETVFSIPREFIQASVWPELESSLKRGTRVWFGYRVRGNFIIELQVQEDGQPSRTLIPHELTQERLGARLEGIAERSNESILFGLAIPLMALAARALLRRRKSQ